MMAIYASYFTVAPWQEGGGGGGGLAPPPIVETCRKIGNIVGIFVVKHTCIHAGPPSASSKKCYESNYNVLIRKHFLPKKLSAVGGGGGG